jgi:hypothetical protein
MAHIAGKRLLPWKSGSQACQDLPVGLPKSARPGLSGMRVSESPPRMRVWLTAWLSIAGERTGRLSGGAVAIGADSLQLALPPGLPHRCIFSARAAHPA